MGCNGARRRKGLSTHISFRLRRSSSTAPAVQQQQRTRRPVAVAMPPTKPRAPITGSAAAPPPPPCGGRASSTDFPTTTVALGPNSAGNAAAKGSNACPRESMVDMSVTVLTRAVAKTRTAIQTLPGKPACCEAADVL